MRSAGLVLIIFVRLFFGECGIEEGTVKLDVVFFEFFWYFCVFTYQSQVNQSLMRQESVVCSVTFQEGFQVLISRQKNCVTFTEVVLLIQGLLC